LQFIFRGGAAKNELQNTSTLRDYCVAKENSRKLSLLIGSVIWPTVKLWLPLVQTVILNMSLSGIGLIPAGIVG
jgi:hypothetical protein